MRQQPEATDEPSERPSDEPAPRADCVFFELFLLGVPLGSLDSRSVGEGKKMVQVNQSDSLPSAFNSQTGKTFPEGLVHENPTR